MTPHAGALHELTAWRPVGTEQLRLRDRYLAHLRRHDDGWSRTCTPEHLTASVMVLDHSRHRVLLTLHRKARRWFQLGGHLEAGDAGLLAAARREAGEESGLVGDDLALDGEPLLLHAHPVPFCGSGPITHLDVLFAAVAAPGATAVVSAESLDVAWWDVEALPHADLAPLVACARKRLAPPATS